MKLDPAFIFTAMLQLLSSLPVTLFITVVSVFCGLLIGTVVALIRIYRVPVLHPIAAFYVMFFRGTPMLMHLLLVYFGLPMLIDSLAAAFGWSFHSAAIPMLGFVLIAFSLTAGSYLSEVIRAAILSINRGQIEAAYSVGMTTWQALRRIVFPQAFAVSLPNLSNGLIGMLHGSTLAYTVSVVEINAKALIVASTNWKFLEAFIAAALIFWGVTLVIEKAAALLEKRLNTYNRGGVA
ncbi:amino acid ABC transporter permease [Paenibacillus eucommiae]|uniref:L-cystine transport system permease protein n=1 Tax=Paenibacillus eucommiae TaxID=1355755 RepID=A0ABS4IYU2_9BACL|nr:amino acid ABC transporter permease [Paenibacillus eucommiae]MBP1992215.1 L-cystine transport system permease protein [Paenibacillus eucommiae]